MVALSLKTGKWKIFEKFGKNECKQLIIVRENKHV